MEGLVVAWSVEVVIRAAVSEGDGDVGRAKLIGDWCEGKGTGWLLGYVRDGWFGYEICIVTVGGYG